MLQDATNTAHVLGQVNVAGGGTTKTFQRRKKVVDAALAASAAPLQTPHDTPAAAPTPSSSDYSPESLDDGTDRAASYGWLGLGLRNRRSSMVVPCALMGLSGLLQQNGGRATKRAQQRMAAYMDFLQEMSEYFAEVDAFELVEESPDKATTTAKAKRKSQAERARREQSQLPHVTSQSTTTAGKTACGDEDDAAALSPGTEHDVDQLAARLLSFGGFGTPAYAGLSESAGNELAPATNGSSASARPCSSSQSGRRQPRLSSAQSVASSEPGISAASHLQQPCTGAASRRSSAASAATSGNETLTAAGLEENFAALDLGKQGRPSEASTEAVASQAGCIAGDGQVHAQGAAQARGTTDISTDADSSVGGSEPGSAAGLQPGAQASRSKRSSLLVSGLSESRRSSVVVPDAAMVAAGRRSSVAPTGRRSSVPAAAANVPAAAGRRSSAALNAEVASRRSSSMQGNALEDQAQDVQAQAEPSVPARRSSRRSSALASAAAPRDSLGSNAAEPQQPELPAAALAPGRRSSGAGRKRSSTGPGQARASMGMGALLPQAIEEDAEAEARALNGSEPGASSIAAITTEDDASVDTCFATGSSGAEVQGQWVGLEALTEEEEEEELEQEAEEEEQDEQQQESAPCEQPTCSSGSADTCVAVGMSGLEAQQQSLPATSPVESEEGVSQLGPELTPLQELLKICGQDVDEASIPSMEVFLSSQAELKKVVKIGEGTYGEAFKYNKLVFKVVPIEGEQWVNNAPQKRANEMAAEALIALSLTKLRHATGPGGEPQENVTACFVETFSVGVCRGPYPKELIRAWKKWDKAHTSENDPVDGLPADQLYLVISMGDCGRDLEKYNIASFDQARALMAQVAFTLAVAEQACEFEHRDMHYGNVLVRPADATHVPFRLRGVELEVLTHGVAASLIDFTASRLRTLTGQVAYCDLSLDPELFQGTKGNVQCDTYRFMRKLNGDDWATSCLQTNCMWMAYLAEIIALEKSQAMNAGHKRKLREFRKRAMQCASCGDLIFDDLFKGLWVAKQ